MYKICLGLDSIDVLINKLQSLIKKDDKIVLLRGDLASGKTTLVKSYVQSLGYNDKVTSPTFSLQSVYGTDIYHYDIYNKTLEEFIALGLLEEFENSGIHFVEWADEKLEKLLKEYGFDTIIVNIIKLENKREYTIES